MAWAFLYQIEIPLCLVKRLAGGAALFCLHCHYCSSLLASGSLQAVHQPLGTSSGVWLVYSSHVLTCICLQHVVGICLWYHCCSSPLGIRFSSGCSTVAWYKHAQVCGFSICHTCARMHMDAASCRCSSVLSLL